jgi:FkbM family methyltransferase
VICDIAAFGATYRIENPGGRVGSKVARGEPYERKLLVDIHQHKLSGTAFDVGAHVGNHTLYLAAICGLSVHAWEPHDQSRAMLEANLVLNPGLDITVHAWAAGARVARGQLTPGRWVEFDPSRDGAALKLDRGHVSVRPIDAYLDVSDLAVVKVDVEGMEADAIEGAIGHIERCRPLIYSETHTPESHDSVAQILEPLGYRMTRAIHMGSTMERWSP